MMKKRPQRTFNSDAQAVAFLLGGIGTGNVSIGSRVEFRDWEIFNRAEKGAILPFTGFYIWAKRKGQAPVTKVLEARLPGPHTRQGGYHPNTLAGMPRLAGSIMRAEYPFVNVDFSDKDLPVKVSME